MGKNKNKSAKPAAVPPAPEVKEEKVPTVEPEVINNQKPAVNVIETGDLQNQFGKYSGLDANHQVELLAGLDRHYMRPNAAQELGIPEDAVKKINAVTAAGWVAVLANEVMYGQTDFAAKLNKAYLPTIQEVAANVGITFDQKLLAATSEGEVSIPSSAVKISPEAKKALKAEHDAIEKSENVDPTKVETEEQLASALLAIIAREPSPFNKLKTAIAFYKAYAAFKGKKDDNKELLADKDASDVIVLNKIKNIVSSCPFVINSMGNAMCTFTGSTKTPIPAFCMFLGASTDRKTGERHLTENEVADYVKFIVTWSAELRIKRYQEEIKKHEENLKILNKDKKANAKGIEKVNESIATQKKNIDHCNEIINTVADPSFEVVDNLLVNYNEKDQNAMRIFKYVVDTYYSNVDKDATDPANFKHNVQQQAGIILNFFRDSASPNPEYNIANLTEMPEKKEEEPSEKTDESSKKE